LGDNTGQKDGLLYGLVTPWICAIDRRNRSSRHLLAADLAGARGGETVALIDDDVDRDDASPTMSGGAA
jgi:hypothetical protein